MKTIDYKPMVCDVNAKKTVKDIRRENLRRIAQKKGGISALAELLNRDKSRISQIIGKNPVDTISEDIAREYERLLSLPEQYLDEDHFTNELSTERSDNMLNQEEYYSHVGLIKKYIDMAYGLRFIKNDAKNIIFNEMLNDKNKFVLTEPIAVFIKDILDDETKLVICKEVLSNIEIVRKLFSLINQNRGE